MKKKIFKILLAVAIAVSLVVAVNLVANAEISDFTYNVSNNEATITGYRGTDNAIEFPSTLGGYPVTAIGDHAFYRCTSLTSVTIPDSVKSIGYAAFCHCTSLTNVTIGNGVTRIGNNAFADCTSLENVTLGYGVTSIGFAAFGDCTSLTDIIIPDRVTSIGQNAFQSCVSLKNATIGAGVTSIGTFAFDNCTSLTSVTIGNSVTSIGDSAFKNCTALTSVTIPDSVISIGEWAFGYCSSLTDIKIPDSVTSIGSAVFYKCTSLESITIPNSVTSINNSTFEDCTSLTNVTIPNGVTNIGNGAFYNCTSLKNVYFAGTQEQWNVITIGGYNTPLTNATIHYLGEPADYTAVQEALAKVPIDLTIYTTETAQVVTDAINAVDYTLAVKDQATVDAYAKAIEDAVSKLQYKPADYSAVEEALAKVPADLTVYTYETANAVTDAVNAVVYDLTADQQATVDGYAQAIEDAVSNLELFGTIKLTDNLVNYRLRCTTAVVDGNLVLTATTAGTSSMKVRLGNLPEGATVAMVGTNANASMSSGIITVTNPGMKNVNVPMVITSANGVKTEFVLVADFNNAIRYATYARLAQTGNNVTVTSGAATAYVLFDTTEIDGGYVEVENVSRNLLGRYTVSGSAVRFYNPVYDNGTATVNVKNGNGEIVETYNATAIFADATEYTPVLSSSLRCTYTVDGDTITVTANAGVSNVYLNFGRYYSETLTASANNDIVKKMGARSWRIMAADEPLEFDIYFDATAYGGESVTRHVTVNF